VLKQLMGKISRLKQIDEIDARTICFISTTASYLEMAASSLSSACLVDMMSRAPAANELEINSAIGLAVTSDNRVQSVYAIRSKLGM